MEGAPFSVYDFSKSILAPTIASVVMGVICFLFTLTTQLSSNILICLCGALLGLITYISIYLIFKRGRFFIFELFSYVKIIFNR